MYHARDMGLRTPLLSAWACVLVAACSGDAVDEEHASQAWPVALETPGVLGYVAVHPLPLEWLRDNLGVELDGTDPALPSVILVLDESIYGGHVALALPLMDSEAFFSSLERTAPRDAGPAGVRRLQVVPQSPLHLAGIALSTLRGQSPLGMIGGLADAQAPVLAMHASDSNGRGLLAPSFESATGCRRALKALGAADVPVESGATLIVASLDLVRGRVAYAREITEATQRLRALLGVGRVVGISALLRGARDESPIPPVNPELLGAVLEMLPLSAVEAVRVTARLGPAPSAATAEPAGLEAVWDGGRPASLELRIRLAEGSVQHRLLSTMEVPASLPGFAANAAVRPDEFTAALVEWLRPLGEVLHGEGAPCDAWLGAGRAALSPWDGRVAVREIDDTVCILVGLRRASGDIDAEIIEPIASWLAPALTAWRPSGQNGIERVPGVRDGAVQFRQSDGDVVVTAGTLGHVLWIRIGPDGSVPEAECAVFDSAVPVENGRRVWSVLAESWEIEVEALARELVLSASRRGGM